jgi:NTE family protein
MNIDVALKLRGAVWEEKVNKMLDAMDARLIAGAEEQVSRAKEPTRKQRQIVLVFQGGGALWRLSGGAIRPARGWHRAGLDHRTSIGAINVSLIAGNKPENRLRARGILAPDAA